MKKLDQKKKAFLLLATYFIILLTPKLKKKQNNVTYNSNYQINEDNQFATYNNYNIYIYNEEHINKMNDDNDPNNIYIIDHRYEENPNIRIYNSYRIHDRNEMFEILKILLEYENRYPTNWNRTIDTMENEWIAHNIGYLLGIETIRTKEVDFDNDDEENYQNLLAIIDTISNDDYSQKESDKMIKKLTK